MRNLATLCDKDTGTHKDIQSAENSPFFVAIVDKHKIHANRIRRKDEVRKR